MKVHLLGKWRPSGASRVEATSIHTLPPASILLQKGRVWWAGAGSSAQAPHQTQAVARTSSLHRGHLLGTRVPAPVAHPVTGPHGGHAPGVPADSLSSGTAVK